MNGSAVNLRVYNNYYKYQGRSNFPKVEELMKGPSGKSQKVENPQTPSSYDQGCSNGKISLGSKASNSQCGNFMIVLSLRF